jgi:hypothetical protein
MNFLARASAVALIAIATGAFAAQPASATGAIPAPAARAEGAITAPAAPAAGGNYFAKYISCTVYKDNPFEKEVQFHAAVRGGTTPVTVTARVNEDDGYVLGLPATLPSGNSDYAFFQYVPADVTTAVVTQVDFTWEDGSTGTFPVVFDPTNAHCVVGER